MTTIAVIEDDLPIGNLLEEVLEQQGYAVRRAYSGTEALYLLWAIYIRKTSKRIR